MTKRMAVRQMYDQACKNNDCLEVELVEMVVSASITCCPGQEWWVYLHTPRSVYIISVTTVTSNSVSKLKLIINTFVAMVMSTCTHNHGRICLVVPSDSLKLITCNRIVSPLFVS